MVYPDNKTVLYVSGFGIDLRARDLAYEFERYGRLVRCDIPALKSAQSLPFAFVEFRRPDDAEDAYYDMHGRAIDGRRITVQWAKRPPSTAWRHDGGMNGDRGSRPYGREDGRGGYDDRRGGGWGSDRPRSPPRRASPPRRDYEDRPRDVGRDADRGRDYDRSPRRDPSRDDRRGRSASPRRGSVSGDRAQSPRGAGNGDRLRSQSPPRGAAYAGADEEKRDSRDD